MEGTIRIRLTFNACYECDLKANPEASAAPDGSHAILVKRHR
jgi:hypothetical protein